MVDIIPGNLIGSPLSAPGGSAKSGASGGLNFMDMITSGVETVRDAQKTGEALSADALMGKADMSEVVQAVSKAEVMLQTMVAIRDKMLSAYQELMNTRI